MHLVDLDTKQVIDLEGRSAEWLVHELLDQDYDWDSSIVRITRKEPELVQFARLETYKRTPKE